MVFPPLKPLQFFRSYNIMKGGMSSSTGTLRSVTSKGKKDQFQQAVSFHVSRSARQGIDELLYGQAEIIQSQVEEPPPPSFAPVYHNIPSPMVTRPSYVSSESVPVWNVAQNGMGMSGKRALPPMIHDISFIDRSVFTPGCMVAQIQFKHVYRDYVIPRVVLELFNIIIGEFLITKSHLDPRTIDMGVVTQLYTADQFLEHKQLIGRSQDEEENFIGTVLRVATYEERMYLPAKYEREIPTLQCAKEVADMLGLMMDVYVAEYQFDGKVLYLYYTADSRVDYRGLVHAVSKACNNTRVKMKKTNQCRKFLPHEFASVGLRTGETPAPAAAVYEEEW